MPLICARTFGGMEKGMPEFFPFSIVDREPRRESQLVDCFFDLLEFFDGRAQPGGNGLARLYGFPGEVQSLRTRISRLSGIGSAIAMLIGA